MPVDNVAARSDSASTRCRRSFGLSRVLGRRGAGIVRGLSWGDGCAALSVYAPEVTPGADRADSTRAAIQTATPYAAYFGAAPVDLGRFFTASSPIFWPIAAPTSAEFR